MDGVGRSIERTALGNFPTPFEPAPRLTASLGGPPVWIKREDLSGLALGGNKTRQVEVLMAEARRLGADTIVTTAAAQSNFCRTVAAAGAKLGVAVHLLLRGDDSLPVVGNLLLDRLFGARIAFIHTSDPYDPAVATALERIVAELRGSGKRPHLLHMTGRAAALGAASYVAMAEELQAQWQSRRIAPAAVYVTAGSGLTVAGLALGLKLLGAPVRVVGICAQKPADFLRPIVFQRVAEAAALLGVSAIPGDADIELDDAYLGPGYGIADAPTVAAVDLAARTEGLLLDPVYTGKCMAGLIAHLRAGRWRGDAPVVFLHSGGAPGLFAYGAERLAAARHDSGAAIA